MKTNFTLFILAFFLAVLKVSAQTITAVATPSTCAANGKIELTATGIPEPIIYGIAKSPYTAADVISSTSSVFSFLEPGNYYYGYYNGANFIPSASTISVANQYNTSSPTFSSYYSNPYAYCTGTADPLGRINASMTGGNKTYKVELINSSNITVQQIQTIGSATNVIFDGVAAGNYTLRATDACGTVVYAPNTLTVKANVPYTDFTLGTVNTQPTTSYFNVVYNTPGNICSGIATASITNVSYILNTTITDITTPTGGPTFYGGRNPVYKLEIQNASGGFDVYDNLTSAQVTTNNSYPLPNDRSKWGLIKLSVTICGITKTNQLDLAQYNEFKIKPFTYVGFSIYDDPSPAACVAANQVEVWTSTYQSGGCQPITLDVTENGTSNTQHYELPQNFKFKLDIGKTYTVVAKDGTGALLPSYVFKNLTSSPTASGQPNQTDPNNLYINPAYFMPKPIRDKITFTDGLSGKNIGKSALVVNNLITTLGLVAPVHIESVSGPSAINLTVTPTASTYNIGVGNNLTPGTYKIRIRDSQCFSEDYDIVLDSYIISVALQNVTSTPSTTTCDRYIKKGEIKVTAVGKTFDVSGPLYSVYGYDYAYPRILSAPAGASVFISTDGNFLLKGNAVIPFSFSADLGGNYQLALSRKNDSRLLQVSEIFENTTAVPLTVQPNFPAFDLTQSGGVICPGNTTGNLTVKVNNAVGAITYFIKKASDADFPATGQTSTVFTGLTADTYVVKAKTLCYEVIQSFKLAPLAQLTDVIFGDNTYCTGASLYFSTVAVGPVSSIVWTLPNNSTITSSTLNIQNLTAANSGLYRVTINSTAGCVINGSTMVTVNPLAEVAAPVFNASSPSLMCQSVAVQQSDYTATAANASSISYHISPPEAGTMGAGGQPGQVQWNPAFNGTAIITAVSSGCGVDKSTTFTVIVSPRADASKIIAEDRTICPNEKNIDLEIAAPTISNALFTWYDSDLASAAVLGTGKSLIVSPVTTTTYYAGVQGDDVCINVAGSRKAVKVTVNPVAKVSDISAADQTICNGETAILTATSPLVNPLFVWYTDPDLENSISNTETAEVSPSVTTTYYVTVSADGVCTIPPPAKAVVVTVNPLPTGSIQATGPVCIGDTTAPVVSFTGTNGTAPYTFTYKVNNGSDMTVSTVGSNNIVNVPVSTATAGSFVYTLVSVKDSSSTACVQLQTGTATVTINPLPTASITATGPVCKGDKTVPLVTFTGANGTPPYTFTYSLNAISNLTVSTTSGNSVSIPVSTAASGNFVYRLVSVKDSSSSACSQTQTGTATVIINPIPTATITTNTTAVCKGGTAPTITFTGGGSVVPYTFTYKINGGVDQVVSTTISSNIVTVTAPTDTEGNFVYSLVSVKDGSTTACAQAQTGSITIKVNPLPTAAIAADAPVCKGAASPNVTFTGANGTAPYTFTYKVNGGADETVTTTSGNSVAVAVPTSIAGDFVYTLVKVKDGITTNCEQLQTGTATITVNSLPTATIAADASVCKGAASPNVTFTGANGTAPYTFTYKVNGGADETVTTTSGNLVSVAAPTGIVGDFVYTLVSVQDGSVSACTQTQSGTTTITVNPLPTATISGTTAVCFNADNPNITFTGAGGTTPYTFTYKVNGGADQTVTTTGGSIATVEVSTTDAVGSFVYTLVSVKDGSTSACTQAQTGTATITVNPVPSAAIDGTATVCQNAAATVTFTGADGTAPYTFTYNIDGAADQTVTTTSGNSVTITASTAAVGTFYYNLVSVKDGSSTACESTRTGYAIITVNPLSTATISGTTTVCKDAAAPNVTFTGAGGTAPYTFTYKLNNGADQTVTTTSGNSVTVAQPTGTTGDFVYTLVSVKDASTSACTQAQTGTATITVNPLPTATISGTTAVCKDAAAPTVTFTGAGGTAPYTFTYKVNNGADQTVTTTSGNAVTVAQVTGTAGTFAYTLVSVKDASSTACTQAQIGTATITVNPLPTATISGTTAVCKDAAAPTVTFTGAGGTAPYIFTYKLNNGADQSVTTTSGNSVTVAQPTGTAGTFAYTLVSVKDASSTACTQAQTGTATITVNPLPTATISGTTTVCKDTAAPTVTFTGAGGTAPYTFTYKVNSGADQTVTTTSGSEVTVAQATGTVGDFVYTLVSVKDASSTACTQAQTGTAAITVNALLALSGTASTTCAADGSGYVLNFTVTGQAPYTVTGTGAPGTWSGNDWTSSPITAGTNYNVSVTDAHACNTVVVADTAPICCVYEVTAPTFPSTTITCYDQMPTAVSLTKAEFEALGNGDGKIGNIPCGVIEITASNGVEPSCNGNVTRTYTVTEYADPNGNKVRDLGEDTVLNTTAVTQIFTLERADFVMP
ncbi:beta strand repeat-containing protein, partial [Flavobacterium sp. FlaQc-30]|uniref:beta strand repeat-containing protein n=1 Tax=Flavobacterium sp. FlaQc-30 TaxID=3374179 RepID=UPI003756CAA7